MTLPASGAMTIAMINVEMQKAADANFSLNDPEVRRLAGKLTGEVLFSDFYGKIYEFVAFTTGNVDRGSVQNFFTPTQWSSAIPKRLINLHVLFSADSATPALVSGTGRGGELYIENRGSILGGPGKPNSGVGGDAFRADQACTIYNYGQLFGGGGGAGRGGNGGPGFYDTANTVTEGPFAQEVYTGWPRRIYGYYSNRFDGDQYENGIAWAGTLIHSNVGSGFDPGPSPSPYYSGGYTYYRGAAAGLSGIQYYVYRTYPSSYRTYTTGGLGGSGGWGAGYSGGGSRTGIAGSAGGINAGAGAAGGLGGDWGLSGATGGTGVSGNNGGGTAGTAGAVAGRAIFNNGATATLSPQAGSDVRGR